MKQKQLIFDFLSSFSNMLIDLHFISHRALFDRSLNEKLTIAKSVNASEAIIVLQKENAFWKNKQRKENVYFSYSKSNEAFDIAFIDDIQKIDKFKEKQHFLLVQTSSKKYQAYFKLSRFVNQFELYKIQKALCHVYSGDTGALSPYQLKRLPAFYNTKYNPHFLVRVVFQGAKILDVDKVLAFYEKHFEKVNNINTYRRSNYQNKIKAWLDFADSDLSVADMKYVCYLVRMGLSDKEITERLLNESPRIRERKRNYKDYIERTIRKARQYVL